MEKTFKLEPKEQQVIAALEQENLRLSARYGQLRREQDDVDKRLATSDERQRDFLRTALANRGVERVDAAQIINGALVCRVPDEEIPTVAAAVAPEVKRLNGAPATTD